MEKILLIQCHRGNSIGEIEIEHINNEGYFYYNYKKEVLDNEIESKGTVFLVQFKDKNKENKIKQPCAMALGKYKELEINSENSKKGLLKIEKIKPIKFNEKKFEIEETEKYKKVIEIIGQINSVELNDDVTHNLVQIDIKKSKFKVLKQLAADADFGKEDEEIDSKIVKAYDKLERKETLCNLAQRSIYANRVENKGDPRENRTEYQRDWERIIHSKSFRRLEDKAQIYTLAKGDHFRTRLTHTLEVTQIARGIARELNLNEDLVEAIALGHDLGHTPFGHAGERILNIILEDEKVEGGFKHNFQGVKVVNYLEEKYGDFEGIDLTYQVMEGILKHTKTSDCKDCSQYDKEKKTCNYWNPIEALECNKNHYQIKKFLCKGDVEKLHLKYNFSTTLEGQVVAVADEIAQRAHDLDDGIASGIIDEEKFLEDLDKDIVFKELKAKIDESLNYIKDDKRDYIDKLDIKRARIISDVITYFIAKIVERASSIIEEKENQIGDISKKTELIIDEEIIKFYDDIDIIRDRLDSITSKKIIESEGVKSFDEKGKYIIKELYKAYYEEPIKRMPKGTLKRISREIFRYMNDAVDISQDAKYLVDKEIEIYKKRIDDNNKGNLNEQDIRKHKIFVRSIVDFISGMTDEFAIKQFKEIYFPITYQI